MYNLSHFSTFSRWPAHPVSPLVTIHLPGLLSSISSISSQGCRESRLQPPTPALTLPPEPRVSQVFSEQESYKRTLSHFLGDLPGANDLSPAATSSTGGGWATPVLGALWGFLFFYFKTLAGTTKVHMLNVCTPQSHGEQGSGTV